MIAYIVFALLRLFTVERRCLSCNETFDWHLRIGGGPAIKSECYCCRMGMKNRSGSFIGRRAVPPSDSSLIA